MCENVKTTCDKIRMEHHVSQSQLIGDSTLGSGTSQLMKDWTIVGTCEWGKMIFFLKPTKWACVS